MVEDRTWLLDHIKQLTTAHEANSATPWKVSDAPDAYIAAMIKGIVGIELPIASLEGKWKLSQNRSTADRQGVASELEQLDTESSRAMEALVRDAI